MTAPRSLPERIAEVEAELMDLDHEHVVIHMAIERKTTQLQELRSLAGAPALTRDELAVLMASRQHNGVH